MNSSEPLFSPRHSLSLSRVVLCLPFQTTGDNRGSIRKKPIRRTWGAPPTSAVQFPPFPLSSSIFSIIHASSSIALLSLPIACSVSRPRSGIFDWSCSRRWDDRQKSYHHPFHAGQTGLQVCSSPTWRLLFANIATLLRRIVSVTGLSITTAPPVAGAFSIVSVTLWHFSVGNKTKKSACYYGVSCYVSSSHTDTCSADREHINPPAAHTTKKKVII